VFFLKYVSWEDVKRIFIDYGEKKSGSKLNAICIRISKSKL
jgi:hypothetical protein